jgi:hypothetical protein
MRQSGVALIEFVLVLPILGLLLFGALEVTQRMLVQLKVEKAGFVLGDMVTQYNPATVAGAAGEISVTELTQNVMPQLSRMLSPYDDLERQAVILSAIQKTPTGNTVRWQIAGGGRLLGCDDAAPPVCVQSIVNGLTPAQISPAVAGTEPSFPADINTLLSYTVSGSGDDVVIIAEAFYRYEPYLAQEIGVFQRAGDFETGEGGWLRPKILVKRIYLLPRNGALYHLPPDFPVS